MIAAGTMQGCNVVHLLGLYKLTGVTGQAFALTARGEFALHLLWAVDKSQSSIYNQSCLRRLAIAFCWKLSCQKIDHLQICLTIKLSCIHAKKVLKFYALTCWC